MEAYSRLVFMADGDQQPDVQALRTEYTDLKEQGKAMRDVLSYASTPARLKQYEDYEETLRIVKAKLVELAGEATTRSSVYDILKCHHRDYAFVWRHESNVVHRGQSEGLFSEMGYELASRRDPIGSFRLRTWMWR